jgi:hypothetical protein
MQPREELQWVPGVYTCMKAAFVSACFWLLPAVAAPDLLACSCEIPALEDRVKTEVIFIGEALQAGANDILPVEFEVIESFTPHPIQNDVVKAVNGICGGIKFETGRRYLLYGMRLPPLPRDEIFEVGNCFGSRDANEARDEIDYVREWTRKNAYSQNRLSGTLLDSAGKPIPSIPVDLVTNHEPEPRSGRFAFTDEVGRFEFTKVPPGEYVFGINVYSGPLSFRPYPTQYFPGVLDRNSATTIRVYGSEQLEGFYFLVSDRIPTRRIRVQVRWWDDTPVTNAQIVCRTRNGDEDDRQTLIEHTSEDGTAEFTIFATDKFEIVLLHLIWKTTGLQPPPANVPDAPLIRGEPGNETQQVRFVISQKNDQRKLMMVRPK